jgi:ATP-binding cassette subfamily C protein
VRTCHGVEQLYVAAPSSEKQILSDISFRLQSGQAVGIIGPSGSGKSTLARALVGVWPRLRGKIKLDNAALEHWSPDALGKHIGYLPQDVELFGGSIAVNIAIRSASYARGVLQAARAARAHNLILSFPDGYLEFQARFRVGLPTAGARAAGLGRPMNLYSASSEGSERAAWVGTNPP